MSSHFVCKNFSVIVFNLLLKNYRENCGILTAWLQIKGFTVFYQEMSLLDSPSTHNIISASGDSGFSTFVFKCNLSAASLTI